MLKNRFLRDTRDGWWALIIGSASIGLVLAGAVVFVEQLLYWVRERRWETITLRSFFLDERGNTAIPFFSRWLVRAGPVVHQFVIDVFEYVPLWAFLMVVGAVVAVRVGRARQ